MSRTTKPGKRGKYTRTLKTPPNGVGGAAYHRGMHGATERILRRKRKTWTRLGNKRRRQLDKDSIDAGTHAAAAIQGGDTTASALDRHLGVEPAMGTADSLACEARGTDARDL